MPKKKKIVKSEPIKKTEPNRTVPMVSAVLVILLAIFVFYRYSQQSNQKPASTPDTSPKTVQITTPIALPKPSLSSKFSVEQALQTRRSRRDFLDKPLTIKQISQMLWSAQGVTTNWGGRTAPSAKSAYPLTVYLAAYNVDGLSSGIYKYLPGEREALHQITLLTSGNLQKEIGLAIGQNAATTPPALLIISGDMSVMAKVFDNVPNDNNVYLEAGHTAENLYLQAESLGLGMVTMAGFDGKKLGLAAGIPDNETIIYAIPLGVPKP